METPNLTKWHAQALLVFVLVLALRLPFLNQAIQGDDYYYLSGAMHAQTDPLHPTHGEYVFTGKKVSMRGHPHPPLNMWVLGGLLALFGDIDEIRFHAAYILFSLIAGWAMLSLARRFSPIPVWATLLFLAVPTFLVNGNSLESDIPFLAFWMASAALFIGAIDRHSTLLLVAACAALVPASLGAYQSVLLMPIVAVYLWIHRRGWTTAWVVLATPAAVIGLWQLFERITGGALPASVLAGHFEDYGLQAVSNKLDNAVALTVHAGWIVFPLLVVLAFWRLPRWGWAAVTMASLAGAVWLDAHPLFWITFGVGVLTVLWCLTRLPDWRDRDQLFLAAWVTLFFAAAIVLFFAGSARYLLPMAAPVCLLVTRQLPRAKTWLAAGLAIQLIAGLGLTVANYQHWDGYRQFVLELEDEFPNRRVWVNGEWGLRYYAEALGGLALERTQPVQSGDMVLTSELSFPTEFTTGGGVRTELRSADIESSIPLQIIGLDARSTYSTVTLGYRPFDIVGEPIDRVRAEVVVERKPVLEFLPMNAPEAETQIVSGVYKLENDTWRWMAGRGVLLLKPPSQPALLEASFYIPELSPARTVTIIADGVEVASSSYPEPGSYTLTSEDPVAANGNATVIEILTDGTFSPAGDQRELGLVLNAAGFREP